MRKPSAALSSRIIQAAAVLLVVSACDSERSVADRALPAVGSDGAVTGSVGGGASMPEGFAARDEAREEKLSVVNQSAPATAPAQPAPALMRSSAASNAAA